MNLLLLSNSRNPDSGYLEHARGWLSAFLSGAKTVAFVPYAAVTFSYDEYERAVSTALEGIATVRSVHRGNPVGIAKECDAIAVGGGNTFHLLHQLNETGLLKAVRGQVEEGKPYCGWSAGSNVASPTIRTTNDMPIIEPVSFESFGFLPFQINPHYLDAHPDRHMGETREQRIQEFCTVNPDVPVVGLREGSAIRTSGSESTLLGSKSARIFRGAEAPVEIPGGSILNLGSSS